MKKKERYSNLKINDFDTNKYRKEAIKNLEYGQYIINNKLLLPLPMVEYLRSYFKEHKNELKGMNGFDKIVFAYAANLKEIAQPLAS